MARQLVHLFPDQHPILVVDDDETLCGLIATALQHSGYAVRTAGNGLDALMAAEAAVPALVILDMHMPVMDGWECAEKLRTLGIDSPLLLITGGPPAARVAAEQVEADGFLPKPFGLDELLDQVEQLQAA